MGASIYIIGLSLVDIQRWKEQCESLGEVAASEGIVI